MSDRMSAEIWLGGGVDPRSVKDLCGVITREAMGLDWEEPLFRPACGAELLAARRLRDGVWLLHLCAHEVAWGTFTRLEEFCQRRGVAYDRRCDGLYEYDPELATFRPGWGLVETITDARGQPITPCAPLRKTVQDLATLLAHLRAGQTAAATQVTRRIQRRLVTALPVEVPPLTPFEILAPVSRSAKSPSLSTSPSPKRRR